MTMVVGERYSLEREIGRGGMGAVWLGRDEVLGRTVALKRVGVAPGAAGPDAVRAEREARIAASLNHPNIVGVFDLVEEDDHQYLVMEYVPGITLADLVRDRGAVPHQEAARILAQVAHALSAAHAKGIVHRDVKPSNILLREDGHVKLSDFGIARSEADASLTQTGLVTGSPAYLSPEVASGKTATAASDVWSLGATLYHALAGRAPYEVGDNVLGALYQIVNEPPPRLDDAGDLTAVLLATMAHDPRRRWSAEDVAAVLDLVASGEPPTAAVLPTPPEPAGPAATATAPVPVPVPLPVAGAGLDDDQTRSLVAPPGPVTADPVAPAGPPDDRRNRALLPVLVGLIVLGLIGVIVVLALLDDPQSPTAGPSAPPSGTSATSASSTPAPTTSTPTDAAPTTQDLRRFISSYLATASSDPPSGFAQLTAGFQRASGGLEGYQGFWGRVQAPRLQSFSADPKALTVTYTYSYVLQGGGRRVDTVRLQLVKAGDRLLIDGEA